MFVCCGCSAERPSNDSLTSASPLLKMRAVRLLFCWQRRISTNFQIGRDVTSMIKNRVLPGSAHNLILQRTKPYTSLLYTYSSCAATCPVCSLTGTYVLCRPQQCCVISTTNLYKCAPLAPTLTNPSQIHTSKPSCTSRFITSASPSPCFYFLSYTCKSVTSQRLDPAYPPVQGTTNRVTLRQSLCFISAMFTFLTKSPCSLALN